MGIQDGNVDTEGQAHKVSQGNKDSIGNWGIGHLCYILANNRNEGKFKSNRLRSNLVKEISRQHGIQAAARSLLPAQSDGEKEHEDKGT